MKQNDRFSDKYEPFLDRRDYARHYRKATIVLSAMIVAAIGLCVAFGIFGVLFAIDFMAFPFVHSAFFSNDC